MKVRSPFRQEWFLENRARIRASGRGPPTGKNHQKVCRTPDSQLPGLFTDDRVTVFCDRGRIAADCRVAQRESPGVAWMPRAGFGNATGAASPGQCIDSRRTSRLQPAGAARAAFYDTFVDVKRTGLKPV